MKRLIAVFIMLAVLGVSYASAEELTSTNVRSDTLLTVDVDNSSRKVISSNVYKYEGNIFYAGNNPCRVLINCNSGKWKVLLLKQSIDSQGNVRGSREIDMGWERINEKRSSLCK